MFWPLIVSGVSSQEAVSFVVKESVFLDAGEEFKQPIVPILHEGKKYWVVPVILGSDQIVAFFPVRQDAKMLSTSRTINRSVFRTADLLRELSFEKQQISANPSIEWIFTSSYSLRFSNLSSFLNNESFQLTTIGAELDSSQSRALVYEMKSMVEKLSLDSAKISILVEDTAKTENGFFSSPATGDSDKLLQKFEAVALEVSDFEKLALEYREKVNLLKQAISVSSLEPSAKTYLVSLADVPLEFNSIGNYFLDAVELIEAISGIYARVDSRLDSLLNEFDSRIQKQSAFEAIYSENRTILEKTNQEHSSVFELAEFILADAYKTRWKSQSLVKSVETKWKETQKLFNEKKYLQAKTFSENVLADALNVYREGFFEEQEQIVQSNDFLFQLILGLIALLVFLVLFNNREKFFKFVKKTEDSQGFGDEAF